MNEDRDFNRLMAGIAEEGGDELVAVASAGAAIDKIAGQEFDCIIAGMFPSELHKDHSQAHSIGALDLLAALQANDNKIPLQYLSDHHVTDCVTGDGLSVLDKMRTHALGECIFNSACGHLERPFEHYHVLTAKPAIDKKAEAAEKRRQVFVSAGANAPAPARPENAVVSLFRAEI